MWLRLNVPAELFGLDGALDLFAVHFPEIRFARRTADAVHFSDAVICVCGKSNADSWQLREVPAPDNGVPPTGCPRQDRQFELDNLVTAAVLWSV